MINIAIIIGSTRPGRVGEDVAKWVNQLAQQRKDAKFELVDIIDFNLPLLDEPVPAAMGQYAKLHTKAWAAKIDSVFKRATSGVVIFWGNKNVCIKCINFSRPSFGVQLSILTHRCGYWLI